MPFLSVDGGSITGARQLLRRRHCFCQCPAAARDGGHGGADAILVRGRRQHYRGAMVAAASPMLSSMRSCQCEMLSSFLHPCHMAPASTQCCTHTFDYHTLRGLSCCRLSSRRLFSYSVARMVKITTKHMLRCNPRVGSQLHVGKIQSLTEDVF